MLQLWYVTYLISCPSLVGWKDTSSMEEICDSSSFTPWSLSWLRFLISGPC